MPVQYRCTMSQWTSARVSWLHIMVSLNVHLKEKKASLNSLCTPFGVSWVVCGPLSPLTLRRKFMRLHSQWMLRWWRVNSNTAREAFPCTHPFIVDTEHKVGQVASRPTVFQVLGMTRLAFEASYPGSVARSFQLLYWTYLLKKYPTIFGRCSNCLMRS